MIKHMNSSDDHGMSQSFLNYNSKVDSLRNESFEKVFPELSEWYKNI